MYFLIVSKLLRTTVKPSCGPYSKLHRGGVDQTEEPLLRLYTAAHSSEAAE